MTARRVLLISGPSGGGKSTFIRQIVAGTLPRDLRAFMPAGVGDWAVIEANDILKGDLSADFMATGARGSRDLLVHYDIVFIHLRGMSCYEDDPASAVFEGSESLRVVFVRPEVSVVRGQFHERRALHQKRKSAASRLWGRLVRHPLRRLLSPVTGKPSRSTGDVYVDDKWLEECYLRWEIYLRGLADRHPDVKCCVVEPARLPGNPEGFRLVSSFGPIENTIPSENE